jgi:hypothetical protein
MLFTAIGSYSAEETTYTHESNFALEKATKAQKGVDS